MTTSGAFRCILFAFACIAATAQTPPLPYSGVWKLDVSRSRIEAKDPPSASTATILYDGKTWSFSRTHTHRHHPADTWATKMVVDAKEPRVSREGDVTTYSRITREGNEIVLHENYVADNGEKASNTVHYRLEDGGNTLVEDEREVASQASEHNLWVLTRSKK